MISPKFHFIKASLTSYGIRMYICTYIEYVGMYVCMYVYMYVLFDPSIDLACSESRLELD